MKNRPLLPLLALLLLAGLACQRSGSPARSISTDEQLSSAGMPRRYRLHLPAGYQDGTPVPLVLNFHGYGSNPLEQESLSAMSQKADQAGFIVVYPEGLNARWAAGTGAEGQQDVQFVRDLVAALESEFSIDPRQIYATGISNGGGMANRLGCNLADLIAAIAPDAGAYNFWQDCSPPRPVPVLAFHGLDDNIVPFEGGTSELMEPPILDWAQAWADRDGCDPAPATTSTVLGVIVQTWSRCDEGAEVILYALAAHGHSWPGSPVMPRAITSQAVNATDLMWDFFQAHPMP